MTPETPEIKPLRLNRRARRAIASMMRHSRTFEQAFEVAVGQRLVFIPHRHVTVEVPKGPDGL